MPPAERDTPSEQIPFARFEHAFASLFKTYTGDFSALASFYAGDPWSADVRRAAARRAANADYRTDRERVADALEAQNTGLSPTGTLTEATRASLDALRAPEGVAVVTGQQVGLFGGPLYTIYKTLTTLALAEQLREETGRPVAPVFWLAGEDHDFAEVAAARFLRRNALAEARLPAPPAGARNAGPVGRLAFEDGLAGALDQLDEALPASDFKPTLMEAVRRTYAPGTPLLTAFARLLRALLPDDAGLVFASPNSRRLKTLAAPLFRDEITSAGATAERVEDAGNALDAQGGHAQITARAVNFFLLEEEGRLPLDLADDGTFSVRGTTRAHSEDALLDLLERAPDRFSPGVALRPLMQDRLLPTAAYVAGPSETAYHGQLGAVYEAFGIERPVIYPRASVTLVEGKVQKVLDKYDLGVPAFGENLDHLFQRVARAQMDVDLDAVFGATQPPIHQALNDLKPEIEAVERTLGPAVEAARAEIASTLGDLKSKALRAEKRTQDETRAQLAKAQANLFPEGTPQERVVNVLSFMDKYGGASLLEELQQSLSLDTRQHQVVHL